MDKQTNGRTIGIIALILGLLLGYVSVILPWQAATQGQQTVALSLKGVVMTTLVLGLGIVYTFFGKTASLLLGHPQQPSRLGWIFSIVLALIGLVFYVLFKYALENYGYKF